ncbi:MAG: CUB domain-containing protein, partial [Bacteroidota bacterium]
MRTVLANAIRRPTHKISNKACIDPDEYDITYDNDTYSDASEPFSPFVSEICVFHEAPIYESNDVDFYKIQLTTSGSLQIDLKNLPKDYDLSVYESDGTSFIGSNPQTGTLDETYVLAYPDVAPTIFYVKVEGANSEDFSPCDQYTLGLTFTPGPGCGDTFEPNEEIASADEEFLPLGATTVTDDLESFLSTTSDQDFYKIAVESQGQLTVDLSSLPDNYDLELQDAGGNVLDFSYQVGTMSETLSYPYNTPIATTWYIRVFAGGATVDACDSYQLVLSWAPIVGCVDTYEDNDTPASAADEFEQLSIHLVNEVLPSAIFYSGDEDHYLIDAVEDGNLLITLSSLPANYDLAILDAAGGATPYISQQLGTADETISLPISGSPIQYIIKVYGVQGASNDCDRYQLAINWTPNNLCVPPAIPDPYSPGALNGPGIVLNTDTPTFDWEIIPNVTDYELNVSIYPYGPNELVFSQCVGPPPYTLPPNILTSGNQYRWDVQSSLGCTDCKSVPSVERYFQVLILPSPFCSSTTLTTPSGSLQDGSGPLLYANNSNCGWLIQPPNVSSIFLSFSYFDLEDENDYMTVYDGVDATAPVIGQYSGFGIPPVLQANSGSMYIEFTTDGVGQSGGWEASYSTRLSRIPTYEYWFNDDYANKVSAAGVITEQLELDVSLPTTGLPPGLHRLNIRFLDDLGHWSSIVSQYFYKTPEDPTNTVVIEGYEYWMDDAYANAVRVNTPPIGTLQLDELLDVTNLETGLHSFHIRFLDQQGHWSSIISQYFYKTPPDPANTVVIEKYEFWVDDDYANAIQVNPLPSGTFELDSLLDVAALERGLHRLHLRFLDQQGFWSSVVSQYFYKLGEPNLMVRYRYWFDLDENAMQVVNLPNPTTQLELMTNVDASALTNGTHTIHFQFQDTLQQWSSVLTDTFVKAAAPSADFTVNDSLICHSGSIQFSNQSLEADTYFWDFGDGTTSTDSTPSHTYNQAGLFSVQLIASNSQFGTSDTLLLPDLIRVSIPQVSISGTNVLCEGDTVQLTGSGTATYAWFPSNVLSSSTDSVVQAFPTSSTIVSLIGTDTYGCTDTLNYPITVHPTPVAPSITANGPTNFCDGDQVLLSAPAGFSAYLWSNGATSPDLMVQTSGQFQVQVTNAQGCTSAFSQTITTTVLTLPPPPSIG